MYRVISEAILRELDSLEERFSNGATMNMSDLDTIDKAAHAMKCLATYEAMTEGEDYRRKSRYEREYRRY